jgi:hypothetical protein
MTKYYINLNEAVNHGLKFALDLSLKYENRQPEIARLIRSTASKYYHNIIVFSGLQMALNDFWNDKKALIIKEAI